MTLKNYVIKYLFTSNLEIVENLGVNITGKFNDDAFKKLIDHDPVEFQLYNILIDYEKKEILFNHSRGNLIARKRIKL